MICKEIDEWKQQVIIYKCMGLDSVFQSYVSICTWGFSVLKYDVKVCVSFKKTLFTVQLWANDFGINTLKIKFSKY